jgi:ComF family protein
VCTRCLEALTLIDGRDACVRCGAPMDRTGCGQCADTSFAFSSARCAATLARPASRIVTVYKDAGERRLAPVLAGLLRDAAGEWAARVDAITWIPASRSACARRGFDHAELLACELARGTGLPCLRLLALASARDQRGLDAAARRANLAGAYAAVSEPPSHVLLVDDVFTTGATLDAAAAALLEAGAHQVRALAFARRLVERPGEA